MKLFNCWQADLLIRGLFKMDLITSPLRLTLSGTCTPTRPAETRAEELEHILIDAWVHCMSFAFGCIIVCVFYCRTKPWASLTSIRLFIIHVTPRIDFLSAIVSLYFEAAPEEKIKDIQAFSSLQLFSLNQPFPAVKLCTSSLAWRISQQIYLYAKFSCLKIHNWTFLCVSYMSGQVWWVLCCTSQQVLSHCGWSSLSLSHWNGHFFLHKATRYDCVFKMSKNQQVCLYF